MKKSVVRLQIVLAGFLFSSGVVPVSAKVVFTGYADLQVSPQAVTKITASPAVAGQIQALTGAPLPTGSAESRSFNTDSLGLFATTSFNEETDFLMDITYKRIGATAGETRVQYAYLDFHRPSLGEAKVGRVTLPIGYYNEHRFYSFQRQAISPPFFQSAILGLPIADHGVVLSKTLDLGGLELSGAGFLVNGYGPASGSTDTFRRGLGGVSGSLVIANNLGNTNANSQFAYGGNLGLSFLENRPAKVGVSAYQGAWRPNGDYNFTMFNTYLVWESKRLSLIAEGLRTMTDGDKGMVTLFGVQKWESTGGFVEGSYSFIKEETRELALFAGTEQTVVRGKGAGESGREKLTAHKTGVSWRLNPFVLLKAQYLFLDYKIPIQVGGMADELGIRIDQQFLLSMTLTY